jgi:simple sugar transport system permease protein
LSAFIGKNYVGVALQSAPRSDVSWITEIPVIGPALRELHPLVYLSWLLFAAVGWFLYYSRPGLVLRAVGESPVSAHSIGHPVIRIRYLATIFGGAMAGVAGAYLSLVSHRCGWKA